MAEIVTLRDEGLGNSSYLVDLGDGRELAAMGATVVAPAAARLQFPHRRLGDGDQLALGGLSLRALATPGHTPEHLAWLLVDGARPLALFSGGSLLVGAVARTDLISPDRTQQLARALWRSLHQRVLTLPDDLGVYPTHGAGSFCSAPTGTAPTTTIAREKATNPLLAAPASGAPPRRRWPPCPHSRRAAWSPGAPSWSTHDRSPPSPPGTSPARCR